MGTTVEPDWNDIRTFLAVAREGSLSGAARALGVQHTTVSRRLEALERAMGVSLVVRLPGGIALTPLGQMMRMKSITLDRAMGDLMASVLSGVHQVRLALPSGFSTIFAERLVTFHQTHPEISLELTSGSRPVDLLRGEADLALRIGPIVDTELVARRLCMSGWSLYAAPRYLERHPAPSDPCDLAGHDVIGFSARLAGVPGARWIEAHGSGATIVLQLSEMTEVLSAALGGAGLAFLPCMLAAGEPRMVRLTRETIGNHPLSLVFRREIGRELPVRTVIRMVVSVIKDNAALISGASG
jgi:DNA-binding transcriptional LysR family regulator